MEIPPELIDQYLRGRTLVLVGPSVNGEEWHEWADELAKRLALDMNEEKVTPFDIADQYTDAHGPQALTQATLDFYGQRRKPLESHKLLAYLSKCRIYLTTCLDSRLEQAFADAGRPLDCIIRQTDRPFSHGADAARLYKLHGTIDQPDRHVVAALQSIDRKRVGTT